MKAVGLGRSLTRVPLGLLVVVSLASAAGCARVGTSSSGPTPQPSSPESVADVEPRSTEPRARSAEPDRPAPRPRTASDRAPSAERPPSDVDRTPARYAGLPEAEVARLMWLDGPDAIQESAYAVHEDIQERVDFWMEFWQGRGRSYFERYLVRMALYQPVVDRELMERDLPPTLRYLPIIESGYSPVAVSRVGATGLWQFMSPTARWLGLRVDGFVDERRDPFRATETALDYLVSLHDEFDSWFLALAAYNSGPGRVGGVLRRNAPDAPRGDSLFWALSDELPTETRYFVPKLLAASQLAADPARFGFEAPNRGDSLMFERVDVQGTTSLDVVAAAANAELEEVVDLNPALVQRVTPLNTLWSVRVPVGSAEGFAERLALVPPDERVTFVQHRVARGETLGHIAQAYDIRLGQLRAANPGVRPQRLQIGQRLIIPKGPANATERMAATSSRAAAEPADAIRTASSQASSEGSASAAAEPSLYVVRSGDSPWTIARRHGVSVDDLLSWNDMNRSAVLRPGDRLEIRGGAQSVASAPVEYRVQSGDTLSEIAERHGVSTRALLDHNGLSRRSVIRPGQRLRIPSAS